MNTPQPVQTTVQPKVNSQWIASDLKTKFDKLSAEDMKIIEGNRDQASARIQAAYGYSKEKAAEEFNSFSKQHGAQAPVEVKTPASKS